MGQKENETMRKFLLAAAFATITVPALAAPAPLQVLNDQTNHGDVTGLLNGGSSIDTVLNGKLKVSSVALDGNVLAASATGNSADNALHLLYTPLTPTYSTIQVSNTQFNNGDILAKVHDVSISLTVAKLVTGSALSVSNNQISAVVVGNSATNVIGVH